MAIDGAAAARVLKAFNEAVPVDVATRSGFEADLALRRCGKLAMPPTPHAGDITPDGPNIRDRSLNSEFRRSVQTLRPECPVSTAAR